MSSFNMCKKKGLAVQEIVKRHLEERGNKIIDVSEDGNYQKIDIDFIVERDGISTTLEVKTDKKLFSTLNFFIEIGADFQDYYQDGWLNRCEAEYICYYDTNAAKGIIVDYPTIKSLLEAHGMRIEFYDYLDDKVSYAYLLPYSVVKKHDGIIHIWKD